MSLGFFDDINEISESTREMFEDFLAGVEEYQELDLEFEVNIAQMEKYLKIYGFFMKLSADGGSIEPMNFEKNVTSGGITANFALIYLHGIELIHFAEILLEASAVSIDATTDGMVCVSLRIPDIFTKI